MADISGLMNAVDAVLGDNTHASSSSQPAPTSAPANVDQGQPSPYGDMSNVAPALNLKNNGATTDSAGNPVNSGDIVIHARPKAVKQLPPVAAAAPVASNPTLDSNSVGPASTQQPDAPPPLSMGSIIQSVLDNPPDPTTLPSYKAPPIALSDVPADMGKGLVSGVENGYAGLMGLPGTLSNAAQYGGYWALIHSLNALGALPKGETVDSAMKEYADDYKNFKPFLPTVSDMNQVGTQLSNAGMLPLYNYAPKSVPGQYAKTIGEFLPAAETKPVSMLTHAVVPGISSESMGQLTKGTGLEGPARVAGALTGAGLSTLAQTGLDAGKALTSGAPDLDAAFAAQRQGVAMPQMAISTKPAVQGMSMGLKTAPFIGTPIREAADTAVSQIGDAAANAAEIPTGVAVAPEEAGQSMRQGLKDYIGPKTEVKVGKLYDKVDAKVDNGVMTPLTETQKVVSDIMARRVNAGIEGTGAAVDHVMPAVARKEGLNYQGVKDLRSSVREMLKSGNLPANMSQAELKQIYAALSKDLRQSISNAGGPKALAAFERANNYARLVADRRARLDKLLGNEGASEESLVAKLTRLAGTNSAANIRLLTQARRSVSPEEWNDLASAVIGKMGKNRAGEFSGDVFLSDYGKLSERAKDLLFGSTGATTTDALGNVRTLRQSLDDIATLSQKMKQLNKFGNTSGTTQSAAGLGEAGAAFKAITSGTILAPLGFLGSLFGGRAISSWLASPVTAEQVAKWTKTYANAASRATPSAAEMVSQATKTLARSLVGSVPSVSVSSPMFKSPDMGNAASGGRGNVNKSDIFVHKAPKPNNGVFPVAP